jgi:hypothetical protein
MATTYRGIVKNNTVTFHADIQLPDGAEVVVVVPEAEEESAEVAWEALSAEAWVQDWVEKDSELVKEK